MGNGMMLNGEDIVYPTYDTFRGYKCFTCRRKGLIPQAFILERGVKGILINGTEDLTKSEMLFTMLHESKHLDSDDICDTLHAVSEALLMLICLCGKAEVNADMFAIESMGLTFNGYKEIVRSVIIKLMGENLLSKHVVRCRINRVGFNILINKVNNLLVTKY